MSDEETTNMSAPLREAEKNEGLSVIRELSPKGHLQEMIFQFQGKVFDPEVGGYVQLEGVEPFMNQEGIDAFYQYATAVLSEIVTMSNYTNKYNMIHALMDYILENAINHFYLNHRTYGIQNRTKLNIIPCKLLILGLSAFYKAIGAGDRKAATSNIHEQISTMMRGEGQDSNSKSSGFLGKLLGK